jgi:hypothetical protein
MKVLVDVTIHSKHGNAIQCDFKPGSVERSLDLYKEGIPTTINVLDSYW